LQYKWVPRDFSKGLPINGICAYRAFP
jgi:hypothetical protein